MAYLKVEKGNVVKRVNFANLSRRQLKNRIKNATLHDAALELRDHDGDYFIFDNEFIMFADLVTIGGSDDTSKN